MKNDFHDFHYTLMNKSWKQKLKSNLQAKYYANTQF